MREILFRVYDKDENRLSKPFDLACPIVQFDGDAVPVEFAATRKERFVFEQFTGLTDMVGEKVFEGDILLWDAVYNEGDSHEYTTIYQGAIVMTYRAELRNMRIADHSPIKESFDTSWLPEFYNGEIQFPYNKFYERSRVTKVKIISNIHEGANE